MDELPLNRASNPFKNQGYMLRLARQRGDGMLGRRSSSRRRHRRQRRCQRGGGKFSAAKVPIFGTLGTGYQIGKFLGKNLFKLMGMKMKKKYKYLRKKKKSHEKITHTSQRSIKSFLVSVSSSVLER